MVLTVLDRSITMKTLKTILLLLTVPLLLLSFSNCGGAQTSNSEVDFERTPFKITDAYFQNWVAGVRGGGSGTNIYITVSKVPEDVSIEKIYFRNRISEAKNTPQNPDLYIGYIVNTNKKDIIMDSDPMKEAANTPSGSFPFQLENDEAVVSFMEKGKLNYSKIFKLEEKELLAYPQSQLPN